MDAKLYFGENKLHDFHRNGKPLIDHIDEDIVSRLRTFPFHTVSTLAETLSVSPRIILHHLRDSLGFKHDHFLACRTN
jgi:hypothetical protein